MTPPKAGIERARIKQGRASLIGGIAVGIVTLILWTAIAHELHADSTAILVLGLLAATGVAAWIRLADL